jgi:hypothetical protein
MLEYICYRTIGKEAVYNRVYSFVQRGKERCGLCLTIVSPDIALANNSLNVKVCDYEATIIVVQVTTL